MCKYIKVKMLRDDTHGKKGEIITVEERYAQLYLFPKKAVLVENNDKSKAKVELPIPEHLKNILIPIGDNNNENHVDGVVRCACGCETFLISVFGGKNGKDICVGEYESDYALIVKATCMDCHKNHLIFDMSKHGWNGFVCNEGITVPKENLFAWGCKECGSNIHHLTITICSEGKEDFIENLWDDDVKDKKYKKSDWVEAFGWITINLVCYNCGFEDLRWIDYETI